MTAARMQREELAGFLRRHRDRLQPADVGLPQGSRRRTAGLRREEVAQLAGASTDTYLRLEQARGPQPSAQMLTAIARALRLSDDERDHLFHLSGHPPPPDRRITQHVRPGLLYLLDHLPDVAALVISDLGVTLAQNALAAALLGDASRHTGRDRSAVWRWFTDATSREVYPAPDHDHHSRVMVADLRATAARRHGDPDVATLVADLRSASAEFAERWDEHQVAVRRTDRKTIVHPAVGLVEVDCEKLLAPESDQWLLLLTPRPGTDAADRLRLLQVIGLQDLHEGAQAGAVSGTTGPQISVRQVAGSGSASRSLR